MVDLTSTYILAVIIIFILYQFRSEKKVMEKEREQFKEERTEIHELYKTQIQDLLDRLMAKDFTNYKDNTELVSNEAEISDDETEDLEVAKDELMTSE